MPMPTGYPFGRDFLMKLIDLESGKEFLVNTGTADYERNDGQKLMYKVVLRNDITASEAYFFIERPMRLWIWNHIEHRVMFDEIVMSNMTVQELSFALGHDHRQKFNTLLLTQISNLEAVELTEKIRVREEKTKKLKTQKER